MSHMSRQFTDRNKKIRLHLVTSDGCTIANRNSSLAFFTDYWGRELPDDEVRERLSRDCREKGVVLLSWKFLENDNVEGLVRYC